MKHITTTLIIALIWCCSLSAYAQSATTTAGKEFYITYLCNYEGDNLLLKVVVEKPCTITAKYNATNPTVTYWNGWDGTAEVQPGIYTKPVTVNDVISHPIDPVFGTAGVTSTKTITLESTEDVSVYAINHAVVSTDATCILPVTAWGKEYRLATGIGVPLIAVVASTDNTDVTLPDGITTITLHKNQVYHTTENYHAIGEKITATEPVAVFSGSFGSLGPGQNGSFGCTSSSFSSSPYNASADHTYEQLWSVDKWGTEFVVFPVATPGSYASYGYNANWGGMLLIIPDQSGTDVTLTGGINATFNNLNTPWQSVCAAMDGITKISSTEPIMVLLVLPDATMTTIHPIHQRTTRTLVSPFVLPSNTNIDQHAIDLLVPAAWWSRTVIKEDGMVVLDCNFSDNTYNIIDTYDGWHHIRKDWDPNQYANVEVDITCLGGFQAYVSGSGGAESYAFSATTARTVCGTVFPFVHTNDPVFNALFPITAELHAVPPPPNPNPIGTIRAKTLLVQSTTVELYDEYIYIPGTPKSPGSIPGTNQPDVGIPANHTINWSIIGKSPIGLINTPVTGMGDVPTPDDNNHVGFFTFHNLSVGEEYVLALSRTGCMPRYAKVTVTAGGLLGHRFLIPGDVNSNGSIDSQDRSLLNIGLTGPIDPITYLPLKGYSEYGIDATYQPRFDFNADKFVNSDDNAIFNDYLNSIIDMYRDTRAWLDEY